jgi:fatty-acyl-CoA synthase
VVAMSGPGVFGGYLSDSHNREAFVAPGWVNSGDLGRLDAEGYLWITGRAKDLIIRGGHNIDPMAIEEVFFRHPAVAQASVVGQPDVYAGELPIAFVQLKPGTAVEAADLLAFVATQTPERAALPAEVLFVEALPLTAVGKVFKPALRWQAAERVAQRLLSDLQQAGRELTVEVGAHALHGSLVKVIVAGVAAGERGLLERQIDERLDPLVLKHETVWR